MKKGSEITVKIENTEFPSTGIRLRMKDKKIYVKNAFPGQIVKARIKKNRNDLCRS